MYFDTAGPENTETTLILARDEAMKRQIHSLLVASTTGATGLKAAQMFKNAPFKLIVVTHNTGFKEPGVQEINPALKEAIEKEGGQVLTSTMVLRGLGAAIRKKIYYSQEQIVADTLRMMGQGTKVCVEIVAMAADAGLIPCTEVIAVAGTGKGADTALVIQAHSSNHFFDIKIKEVLAKPRNF